jgi:hypothetical protein
LVTVSVSAPAAQGAGLALAGGTHIAGTVVANAGGAVAFAVRLAVPAHAGAYSLTASGADRSTSAQVTLRPTAPLLSAPANVPTLRGIPSLLLPLLRRA